MKLFSCSDYEVIDRNPLLLEKGEIVRLGPKDPAWEGWIWAIAQNGQGSYVPEALLEILENGEAKVCSAFHARDLSVVKGEEVESLNEVKGWHWCRKTNGNEGWLPGYLLADKI